MLPAILPIIPFTRPVRGEVMLPGSKSLTNRALMLAALARSPVTLTGALFSEDSLLMAEALRKLGFQVDADEFTSTLRVSGQDRAFSGGEAELFVGLAGTAARFLTALCAAAPRGIYRLDGVAQMRKRPMKGLIEALRSLGADIRCPGEEGFFPLEIHARGLRGGRLAIDARESSQMLSALLMVGPLAADDIEATLVGGVRWPFVEMTARLMAQFGQPPLERLGEERVRIAHGTVYAVAEGSFVIEPDATAASYFMALPLVAGGRTVLRDLGIGAGLQGDTRFATVLQGVGATVEDSPQGLVVAFEPGARRVGVKRDFNAFSDTFLTLAAIAPLLEGPTRITGIAHTRKQETDRVAGMARELTKLGQYVIEEEDALTITPRPLRSGVSIDTYHDHRFAMSFGILGCHDLHGNGRPWLQIKDPACCAKTFPRFFELLESLRAKSSEA